MKWGRLGTGYSNYYDDWCLVHLTLCLLFFSLQSEQGVLQTNPCFFRPVFSAIMEQRCQSCINPLWCSFVEATIQGVEHGMQQFLLVHAVLEIGTPKILPDMVYLERCILGPQELSHTQPESWHSRFQIPIKQVPCVNLQLGMFFQVERLQTAQGSSGSQENRTQQAKGNVEMTDE